MWKSHKGQQTLARSQCTFAVVSATDRYPTQVGRAHGLFSVTELSTVLLNFSLALSTYSLPGNWHTLKNTHIHTVDPTPSLWCDCVQRSWFGCRSSLLFEGSFFFFIYHFTALQQGTYKRNSIKHKLSRAAADIYPLHFSVELKFWCQLTKIISQIYKYSLRKWLWCDSVPIKVIECVTSQQLSLMAMADFITEIREKR